MINQNFKSKTVFFTFLSQQIESSNRKNTPGGHKFNLKITSFITFMLQNKFEYLLSKEIFN